MSSFENKKNAKEILKESSNSNANFESNFKGISISQNPNMNPKEEEDDINKSNSDIEVNIPLKNLFYGKFQCGKNINNSTFYK